MWNGKQNSLTGPVITESFEKRASEAAFRKSAGDIQFDGELPCLLSQRWYLLDKLSVLF